MLSLLRTARLSLESKSSITGNSSCEMWICRMALTEADNLEAERIQFIVGFLASGSEHLVSVGADRRATWCWHLLGQLDHAPGRQGGVEPAALHAVERGCERVEGLFVQSALFGCHFVGDACESRRRFGGAAGSHIARSRHDDVDPKGLQFGAVNGSKHLHRRLRCA